MEFCYFLIVLGPRAIVVFSSFSRVRKTNVAFCTARLNNGSWNIIPGAKSLQFSPVSSKNVVIAEPPGAAAIRPDQAQNQTADCSKQTLTRLCGKNDLRE